jgi:hypothetical protein
MAVRLLVAGTIIVCTSLAFVSTGAEPLLARMKHGLERNNELGGK